MVRISLSFATLVAIGALAACGDDTSPGSGGGGAGGDSGGGGGTTTASTTTASTTTGNGGGDGQGGGGAGGGQSTACGDDAAICASCSNGPGDPVYEDCVAAMPCDRLLLRDEIECELFACYEQSGCNASCDDVIDAALISATGQAFLDRCVEVVGPCFEEPVDEVCSYYATAFTDEAIEDHDACLEEATCDDVLGCISDLRSSNPACADL